MSWPLSSLHRSQSGRSLRRWRDELIVDLLVPSPALRALARGSAGALWALLALTWAATCWQDPTGAQWAALIILGVVEHAWRNSLRPTLAHPPWLALAAAALTGNHHVALPMALAATSGAIIDAHLRSAPRHAVARAATAASAGAAASALSGAAGMAVVCGVAVVDLVSRLSWLRGLVYEARARSASPPPPEAPWPASVRWERLSRRSRGRAAPFYRTLERLAPGDSEARRQVVIKSAGLLAEQRTAGLLAGLPVGYVVFHDLALLGAEEANTDHLVIGPSGVWCLDTKALGTASDPAAVGFLPQAGAIVVQSTSGLFLPFSEQIATACWGARGLGELLGVRVRTLMVIHDAAVQQGLAAVTTRGERAYVIPAGQLVSCLTGVDPGDEQYPVLGGRRIASLAATVLREVPSATGGVPRPILGVAPRRRTHQVGRPGPCAIIAAAPSRPYAPPAVP